MLYEKDITIQIESQGYKCESYTVNAEGTESVFLFASTRKGSDMHCPECGGAMHIYDVGSMTLKDMPIWTFRKQELCFVMNRYRCTRCKTCFTEEVPFKYPGTRITKRAANWIRELLRSRITIKSVQELTGIHWETVRRIYKEMMNSALASRADELRNANYRPAHLAVDEFAIHKGHTYATCVMDLDTGDVIWVGKGRAKEDFARFFEEIPDEYLSEVKAVAMDMNASYNLLISAKLPNAEIVYDRYHMQAQYGKDVLGAVRLEAARKHQAAAKKLQSCAAAEDDTEQSRRLKSEAKKEQQCYSRIKKLRWTLLTNGEKLSQDKSEHLEAILSDHADLAVCYAMKEELCALFKLSDPLAAADGWRRWFDAALSSGIPALVRFASLKLSRINGLIAHASYPISTGKLEGFNNKIKVAKRIGFGYRDDAYFFTLVRYLALPAVCRSSHNFP